MNDQYLPDFPVAVIHLEDPPGSGLAACCGKPFRSPNGWSGTPRWACTGCVRPRPQPDTASRELREAAQEVIEAWDNCTDPRVNNRHSVKDYDALHDDAIDALRAALQPKEADR